MAGMIPVWESTVLTPTPIIPIQIPTTYEENNMIKIIDAVSQNVTLDVTNMGIRNIWFDGTYWWMGDWAYPNAYTHFDVFVYRYNADWSNKTTMFSNSYSVGGATGSGTIPVMSYVNGNYYVGMSLQSQASPPLWGRSIWSSATGEAPWSYVFLTVPGGTYDSLNFVQALALGASTYFLFYDVTNNYALICDASNYYIDSGRNGLISGAYSDGSYIYFLSYKSTDDTFSIRKWDPVGGFVQDSAPTFSGGASFATDTAQLWKNGTSWVVGWANTLYYKESTVWQRVIVPTAATPAPNWYLDSGTLKIRSFTYANTSIYIDNGAIRVRQLTSSYATSCAWDDYIITTAKAIYKLQTTNYPCSEAVLTRAVFQASNFQWKGTLIPVTNAGLDVYDSAGVYRGFYKFSDKIKQTGKIYADLMISPAAAELFLEITADFSDGSHTDTAIITHLVEDYGCNWIKTGTLSTASVSPKFKWNKTPLWRCLRDICEYTKQIWYLDANCALQYNPGTTDSTVSFTIAGGNFAILEKQLSVLKKSIITISGANGLTSTITQEIGYQPYLNQYPSIIDQTTLDTMRNSLATVFNNTLNICKCIYQGTNVVNIGLKSTVEFNRDPWNVSSGLQYIMWDEWNLLCNHHQFLSYDVFYQPLPNNAGITPETALAYAAAKLDTTTAASTYVALTGDQTIAGVKTFSSFPITPSSSPTTDYQVANKQYIDKANMIGSGNACWIPCIFQIAYPTADSAIQNYGGLGSVSGSSKYWAFKAPIPTNKGGLKLYIKGFRFANATADANNYVTKVDIFGSSANSNVNILNSDTTDWTTAASSATDYDGASVSAIDCSGYADVGIIIQTESNGNNNLIIGAVQLECYYA
jgi:hypothetical protein